MRSWPCKRAGKFVFKTHEASWPFYRLRFSAVWMILLAYLIYGSYPNLNFGPVLLATAIVAGVSLCCF